MQIDNYGLNQYKISNAIFDQTKQYNNSQVGLACIEFREIQMWLVLYMVIYLHAHFLIKTKSLINKYLTIEMPTETYNFNIGTFEKNIVTFEHASLM